MTRTKSIAAAFVSLYAVAVPALHALADVTNPLPSVRTLRRFFSASVRCATIPRRPRRCR